MKDFKLLNNFLCINRSELILVILYGSLVSVFSLAVPIAAQRLVTVVSFGSFQQPLVTLTLILFFLLCLASFFLILQNIIAENIQQRIFTNFSLNLAHNFLNINLSIFDKYRGTELANRFFEIFILNKTLAQFLLNGVSVILQLIFGLILLSVYHPLLLVFALLYAISLILSVWIPWRKGLNTALAESSAKYEVARWLEEIARLPCFFKFNENFRYAYKQADDKIATYLHQRKNHFKVLLIHAKLAQVIQVFASSILLLLGGILIIKNQLTLGQLVASEIVVNALGSNVVKMGKYLENIYDFCASGSKLSFLLSLPIESTNPQQKMSHAQSSSTPPNIKVANVFFVKNGQAILNDINFEVLANEKLAILGDKDSGKSILIKVLLGLEEPTTGNVLYNSIPLKEYPVNEFRKNICYIDNINFFDGSIAENLMISNASHDGFDIRKLLERLELTQQIDSLPQGLMTELHGNQNLLSVSSLRKLMFVRAALSRNSVLIIDDALDALSIQNLQLILNIIHSHEFSWTVIATTRRPDVAELFDRYINI